MYYGRCSPSYIIIVVIRFIRPHPALLREDFIVLCAYDQTVYNCTDTRCPPRDSHGVLRLLKGPHPASKLYDPIVDRAHVDGAPTQNGIVMIRFQDALLQLFHGG